MGDLAEPEHSDSNYKKEAVMNTLTKSLSQNYIQTDSYNTLMNQENQHILRMTLRKKNKLKNIVTQGKKNIEVIKLRTTMDPVIFCLF